MPTTSSYVISGTRFTIDSRYVAKHYIGRGSSGIVASATDTKGHLPVAIKKIANVLGSGTLQIKRTLREVRLLRHFKHENVMSLRDVMCDVTADSGLDLYVVTALMATSLDRVIRSSQPLTEAHVQYFTHQLLNGVQYLHSNNVLHRDLKPSNLLVNENCDLKITDFGLARGVDPADCLDCLTEYVVTRWYRAPEIVLCAQSYTKAVDMWSVGCIVAELLLRRPLFRGSNPLHQLSTILEVLGSPHEAELRHVPPHAALYVGTLPCQPGQSLRSLLPAGTSEEAVALLSALLVWRPAGRPSAEAALRHAFLDGLGEAVPAPTASISPFEIEKLLDGGDEPEALAAALTRELCAMRPELALTLERRLAPRTTDSADAVPAAKPAYHSWPGNGGHKVDNPHRAAAAAAGAATGTWAGSSAWARHGEAEAAKQQATDIAKKVARMAESRQQGRASIPGRVVRATGSHSRVAWVSVEG